MCKNTVKVSDIYQCTRGADATDAMPYRLAALWQRHREEEDINTDVA